MAVLYLTPCFLQSKEVFYCSIFTSRSTQQSPSLSSALTGYGSICWYGYCVLKFGVRWLDVFPWDFPSAVVECPFTQSPISFSLILQYGFGGILTLNSFFYSSFIHNPFIGFMPLSSV
jgi:hypothetical protein